MSEIGTFSILKSLSFRRIWNLARVESSFLVSRALGRVLVWGNPYLLTVEPVNYCNLQCPLCVVGSGNLQRRPTTLEPRLFEQLLHEIGDDVFALWLFNQGEPFLHPQLIELVKIAKKKRIIISISTNGHFLTNIQLLTDLIQIKLDYLIVSLDGGQAQSYQAYRQNGNFSQVMAGIRQVQQLKQHLKLKTPRLVLQCLLLRQNETEIAAVKRLARELKVDALRFKTVQVENSQQAQEYLPQNPQYRRYTTTENRWILPRKASKPCGRLWRSSVILANGDLVACCFDKQGKYVLGTLSAATNFERIWQAPKYAAFRYRALQQWPFDDLCANCTEGIQVYRK
ncbi:SPASM domain-containing protein [candidate division KSB1 bacterium]|nr:SPASM domain-containing protein [candidate division KSB1 bacterium]